MSRKKPQIDTARVYDAPAAQGRYRVLVDRLWPRGVKRDDLVLEEWLKEVAPSNELRKWFAHEFRRRYFEELSEHGDQVAHLLDVAKQQSLLLLYSARDVEHNNAVALREFLLTRASCERGRSR
jgi:uncharacterized protein YeaO (DUF488 family)